MSGLGDLFAAEDSAAARTVAGARLSGGELEAVHGQVRRAHARRSATRASLAALAAVVVGAGAVYVAMNLGGGTPVANSPTPSPSVTASPSPSPSPSITAAAFPAFAGTVTVDPHLPTAEAITPEVWASTGPGWALVSYQERTPEEMRNGAADAPRVIYLVSPVGDRYELVTVDAPGTVAVLAWEAGATSAVASVEDGPGERSRLAQLNLVTGDLTGVDGFAPSYSGQSWPLFLDPGGRAVYRGDDTTSAYVAISPDATESPFIIPNADEALALAQAETGLDACSTLSPFDDESVIVACLVDELEETDSISLVNTANGTVEGLFGDQYGRGRGSDPSRVGDYVVAELATGANVPCAGSFTATRDGVEEAVPGSGDGLQPQGNLYVVFGAVGNSLIWGVNGACASDTIEAMVVVNSNLATGEYSVLIPYSENDMMDNVTGVAVAH